VRWWSCDILQGSGIAGQLADKGRDAGELQLDIDAVVPDINALDQEPDDASLFSWKELIPKRIERLQGIADL
jgi:hypothetical protein